MNSPQSIPTPGAVPPRLQLVGITKRYPAVVANDGVSLTVQPGEVHAVLGENGAGKSTLMKIIYGTVKPDEGQVLFDGKPVNIPSYSVKAGQVIGVREKSKSLEVIADALSGFNHSKYPWIEWDQSSLSGKLLHLPERADIPENIKEQLIVELYSK